MRVEEANKGIRHRISSNLRVGRYVMLAVAILLLLILVSAFIGQVFKQDQAIGAMVGLIVAGILYYLFDHSKTVEYNQAFMFISGKTGTKEIPLKQIFKIKRTMTQINDRSMWKIKYLDDAGQEQSVRILPKVFGEGFREFKATVKSVNRKVEIQNWSHSFDFDQ